MDVDEDNNNKSNRGHHANVECVNDEEFFEFEDVESIMNKDTEFSST